MKRTVSAYVDTEGTFRPDRIKTISERFNVDPTAALENILYARAHNSECATRSNKPAVVRVLAYPSKSLGTNTS